MFLYPNNMIFSSRKRKYDIQQLVDAFPKTLQHEIHMQVYSEAIKKVEFLEDRTYEFYFQLLPLFSPHRFLKQSFLFKEGEIARTVIILGKLVYIKCSKRNGAKHDNKVSY